MPDSLIATDDTILVLVDIQPGFLDALPPAEAGELVTRAAWLAGVAARLDIPIIATLEEPARHGPLPPALAARLPAGTPILNKRVFGLAGDPVILAAVAATGRHTAVLCGLQTDVCVAQSALGLQAAGYRVAVVADACGSPETGHSHGLERLRGAGISLLSVKGLYYEWHRTVEAEYRFRQAYGAELGDLGLPL